VFENHKIAEIFDQNPYMAVIILDIKKLGLPHLVLFKQESLK